MVVFSSIWFDLFGLILVVAFIIIRLGAKPLSEKENAAGPFTFFLGSLDTAINAIGNQQELQLHWAKQTNFKHVTISIVGPEKMHILFDSIDAHHILQTNFKNYVKGDRFRACFGPLLVR